jgi:hypothetical protein
VLRIKGGIPGKERRCVSPSDGTRRRYGAGAFDEVIAAATPLLGAAFKE